MRVLLTGANGQFGSEYSAYTALNAPHDELHAFSHADLDVTNRDQVLQLVHAVRPDVIVHAAAMTNVDGCETDHARALLVNAFGTRNIAEAAQRSNSRVVYLSTDYVFDGRGGGPAGRLPYTEWDTPNPQTAYGRSKLGGEIELQNLLGPDATIVRTSWVCGLHGHNFVKTMVRIANDSSVPSPVVVDDQVGCPTFTADLASAVRFLAVSRLPGLFHVSNTESVSWFGFAQAIFSACGHDPSRVRAISSLEYQTNRTVPTAPRPAFSVLDNVALRGVGYVLRDWRTALGDVADGLSRF